MQNNHRHPNRSIDSGDVPGNPLRSFRMSMLGHGFIDDPTSKEMVLDESDAIGYGVVRIRKPVPRAMLIAWIVVVALIVAAVLILG